jgi:hypothetical protein
LGTHLVPGLMDSHHVESCRAPKLLVLSLTAFQALEPPKGSSESPKTWLKGGEHTRTDFCPCPPAFTMIKHLYTIGS